MTKRKLSEPGANKLVEHYDEILSDVVRVLDESRSAAARSINTVITATYWFIGRRMVEHEQKGEDRAEYGERLVTQLARDLTARFGRGFSHRNLFQMRAFYLAYREKVQTASTALSASGEKMQTASALFKGMLPVLGVCFPLSWSHYVKLLAVRKPEARAFYEAEAIRGGWVVRQLARQINTQFYERALLSKNKAALLRKGKQVEPVNDPMPEEEIKDPFVLEFLDLKDEYSESDLEAALITKLETFLLELGGDFAFIGRQRRLRIGDEWYRVDLLFYHRQLRCLVVIDLKLGKLTHADAGQMHMYLNYARQHWTIPDENPPVGLILCAAKDAAVARYALEGLPNKVLASEYRMALPDEETLATELSRTRRLLEARESATTARTIEALSRREEP